LKPQDPLNKLDGVGPGRESALAGLGLYTVEDLLFHMPTRYEDRRRAVPIADLVPDESAVVFGTVRSLSVRRAAGRNLHIATFEVEDDFSAVSVVLFGGFRSFYSLKDGVRIALCGRPDVKGASLEFQSPDYALLKRGSSEMPPGFDRILPIYPTVKGLPRRWLANLIFSCVTSPDLLPEDPIPEDILARRGLVSLRDALRGVHAPDVPEDVRRSMARLAYGELYEIQKKIFAARAARERTSALQLAHGADMAERFERSLPFELTESQRRAIGEICRDMAGCRPMSRLLHGDVGSGKTAAALSAAAMCAGAGAQTAILVPTTVLSAQFFSEASKYLAPVGIACSELRGGMGARERKDLLLRLADGKIDVIVGTHAMLEDDVVFKSLGLVVIDEQHRFGVRQRERIAGRSEGVHVLMMSATPIPRTLCMALYGDVDTSEIRGGPSCRKPVVTKVLSDNYVGDLYKFIASRVQAGCGCYWVCPLIGGDCGQECDDRSSVLSRASDIEKNIPGVKVERMYGSMKPDEKRSVMERFSSGESGILVSTTVIEVGVDVERAGVMVIESASSFGLSQLHQLRGRVGRGSRAGVCILLDGARNIKNSPRLRIMTDTCDGFLIAEEDLRLRGAGDVAGTRQHGLLNLRFADFPRDSALLEAAREDAGAQAAPGTAAGRS
jgi:ATP-dependent DNA helicase RecG